MPRENSDFHYKILFINSRQEHKYLQEGGLPVYYLPMIEDQLEKLKGRASTEEDS
jgi:hypothetical protein